MTELGDVNGGGGRVIIKYTDKGQPYEYDPATDDPALEHVREKLPYNARLDEIEERYGAGTRLYYSFLKYTTVSNFFLALLGLVSWVPYLIDEARPSYGSIVYQDLFAGSYLAQHGLFWWTSGVVAMGSWFIVALIYIIWVYRWFQPLSSHDNIWAMARDDEIIANHNVGRSERLCRLFGSYTLTFVCMAFSCGVLFGLIELQNYLLDSAVLDNTILAAFVSIEVALSAGIAVVLVAMNGLWIPLSAGLTGLEKHHTWSAFRINNAVKLILFKIINATVLYLLIALRLRVPNAVARAGTCALGDAGSKFFLILIMDIIFVNILQMIGPKLKICCVRKCGCRKCQPKGGDEELRPEFDLAEEYLQILYRQWLLYVGTTSFPLIGMLGFLANLLEYPLDKYRMLRVTQEPKRIEDTMRGFLASFIVIVGLMAAFTYPNGAVWLLMLPSYTPSNYFTCAVVGYFNNLTAS